MAVKYMCFYGLQVSLEDEFVTIFANGRRCIESVFCYLNFIFTIFNLLTVKGIEVERTG